MTLYEAACRAEAVGRQWVKLASDDGLGNGRTEQTLAVIGFIGSIIGPFGGPRYVLLHQGLTPDPIFVPVDQATIIEVTPTTMP